MLFIRKKGFFVFTVNSQFTVIYFIKPDHHSVEIIFKKKIVRIIIIKNTLRTTIIVVKKIM